MEVDKVMLIKEAAIEVFSKKGYKEAKIIDIAEKSGISVGTIYSYFKGKKELFESLELPELKDFRPKYDKKRTDILKKALSVFRENGYDAASMDQIAFECGFTKAVLYQYFKSKEELFSAIFKEPSILHDLDNLVIEYIDESLEEVLFNIGHKFMEMFEDENRLNLTRIVIAESTRFPYLGKIMFDNGVNKVADKFTNYLKVLSQNEITKCANPKLTARSYFGLLYSFVITRKIINPEESEFNNHEIVEYAVQLFVKSLKADS